ncbi:Amidohydrolase family [Acididesulfobacillus acetoxydans]|uniref:Amidohydrolase 3 n=1 Tax=Acididesulfobacillus acetoxydans TaxID=1561005 RepID=A0A8S0Y2B9_9FIRM|nr:amidohydrolase [Acididesulfobacillus acetoxydans]CAA7600595.1 Amidohydrolase family [Acididesulfobacillus acetoxydans]CEJ09376.1 Amidohydrolase 3 [Acididesulfobacillus acetoxydans]
MDLEFIGKIYTLTGTEPVDSMIVRDKKIVYAGPRVHGIPRQTVDLAGAIVLPGFVDCHTHPLLLGLLQKQIRTNPPLLNTLDEFLKAIEDRAREIEKGQWLLGGGFDESQWSLPRLPQRDELDRVSGEHPLLMVRACGHIAVANSLALKLAGITEDSVDPQGGKIVRHEGFLTGELQESAIPLVGRCVPEPDPSVTASAISDASKYLASRGVTTVCDMESGSGSSEEWDLYSEGLREGNWKQRVGLFIVFEWFKVRGKLPLLEPGVTQDLKLLGLKVFADGSISGHTAALHEPYLHDWGRGIMRVSEREIEEAASMALSHGLKLAVHAMGDAAIDLVVTALSKFGVHGGDSFTIEHAALPTTYAQGMMAKHGIGVVTQPIFTYAEIESYLNGLGYDRTFNSYPIRSLKEQGIKVALSSDAPSTAHSDPANPWLGIAMATGRRTARGMALSGGECISLGEALKSYTAIGAAVRGFENCGCLLPGCDADFSLWDKDPFKEGPASMPGEALATYRNGEVIHSAKTWTSY